eukprot:5088444-Pyramimonas_sp.AAC.1
MAEDMAATTTGRACLDEVATPKCSDSATDTEPVSSRMGLCQDSRSSSDAPAGGQASPPPMAGQTMSADDANMRSPHFKHRYRDGPPRARGDMCKGDEDRPAPPHLRGETWSSTEGSREGRDRVVRESGAHITAVIYSKSLSSSDEQALYTSTTRDEHLALSPPGLITRT